MKLTIAPDSTSNKMLIFVQDNSRTDGAGLSGLLFNASGLACYYKRNTATASVAVTLATITTLGTFATGGLKLVDDTNMVGVLEFHPPDAAFVSGADSVVFYLGGAANMAPVLIEIQLSSASAPTAAQNASAVRTELATELGRIDANITTRQTSIWANAGSTVNLSNTTIGAVTLVNGLANNVITAAAFHSAALTAIANEVEAQIIDDTDSEKVLQAITDKIAAVNPSLAGLTLSAIAAAVWDLARSGHQATGSFGEFIDAAISSRQTSIWANAGSTVNLSSTTIAAASSVAALATDAIAAASMSTAAVTKIQNGLATSAALTAAAAVVDLVFEDVKVIFAAGAGKRSGLPGTTETYKYRGDVTKLVMNFDADNNTSSVSYP